MKLVIQIACGILLAGFVSWIFWMTVFVGAATKITAPLNISHPVRTVSPVPNVVSHAQSEVRREVPPVQSDTVQATACTNFVQKANGERHCLENARDSATLSPMHVQAPRQ